MPTKLPLMPSTRVSTVYALAGVLLLTAGCGGSSSNSSGGGSPSGSSPSGTTSTASSGSTPTVSASAPTASPSPTVTPATVAQLKKIVLRATDLPRGWKAVPAEVNDDDDSQAELMRCIGAKNTDDDQVAIAHSADYTLGDAVISSSASSYKSQSALDSDLAVLKSPKLVPCFRRLLTKELAGSLPEGATLGTVSVKFTPGPGTGPENVAGAGQATVPITVEGQDVKVYVSFVYLTGPLMEVEIDAENVGAPVPAAVLQSAIEAVAERAAASS